MGGQVNGLMAQRGWRMAATGLFGQASCKERGCGQGARWLTELAILEVEQLLLMTRSKAVTVGMGGSNKR